MELKRSGAGIVRIRQVALDARFEKREVGIAAPVERQVIDLLGLHHAAHVSGFGLQHRRRGGDFNGLGRRAHLQREVHGRARLHVNLKIGMHGGLEVSRLRFYRIGSRSDSAELIAAIAVGGHRARHTRGFV